MRRSVRFFQFHWMDSLKIIEKHSVTPPECLSIPLNGFFAHNSPRIGHSTSHAFQFHWMDSGVLQSLVFWAVGAAFNSIEWILGCIQENIRLKSQTFNSIEWIHLTLAFEAVKSDSGGFQSHWMDSHSVRAPSSVQQQDFQFHWMDSRQVRRARLMHIHFLSIPLNGFLWWSLTRLAGRLGSPFNSIEWILDKSGSMNGQKLEWATFNSIEWIRRILLLRSHRAWIIFQFHWMDSYNV